MVWWASDRSVETSSVITGSEKKSIECGNRHGILGRGDIWTVEVSPRIASVLFLKLLSNSWSENQFVNGGSGGQSSSKGRKIVGS